MTRSARPVLFFIAMAASSCSLTPYPSGVIPCKPDGAACPDGLRCVVVGDAGPRCATIGCDDGIVDVGIEGVADEQCDDANGNDLDLCVSCRLVDHAPDLDRTFGFGVGASVARGTPLGRPTAIGIDLDGNILVASAQTNVVSRVAATLGNECDAQRPCDARFECINGRCLTYENVAPFGGNGTMVGNAVIAVGDRPNAMSTTFVTSMAVDTFGNVFLGDFQDSVIRRVDAITGLVDTIAGTGIRRASTVTTPTRGTETDLELPASLVVDRDGSLLFTEKAPGGLSGERVRRFDPVTGLVSTVELEGLASTTINDLTLDDAGNLHAFHSTIEFDNGGDDAVQQVSVCHFVTSFARVDGALGTRGTTRGACTRQEERTRETPPRVISATGFPRVRNGQAHFVTADGQRFYILMDDHVVELDLTRPDVPAANIIAVVPLPVLEGGGGLIGTGDDGGSAVPFGFNPTDLTLRAGTLFVADPGNGLVWRFPTTRRQTADTPVGPDDVVAGELETDDAGNPRLRAPEPNDDVINEIALGFARESDGRVGVGASDDCGAENLLDGPAIEFYLAFPDVHRVLFSNCNAAVGILAGTGVAGAAGDGGLAKDAQLHNPTAFLRIERPRADGTFDDAFYVADRDNHRIRRLFLEHIDVDPPEGCVADAGCDVGLVCRKPEAAAPDDAGVCSKPSLLIETFMTEALGVPLLRPSGLAMDDTFALLIADSGNHRVLRHDLETGETTVVFGTGDDDGADGGTAATTPLAEPTSLVYLPLALLNTITELNGDPLPLQLSGGLLVVTERARHRVRGAFIPPIPGFPEVLTLGGDGSAGGDDNEDDGTAGRLHLPRSVMFSIPDVEAQRLTFFVIDAIDRVRELSLSVDLQRFTLQTGLKTLEGGGGPSRSDGERARATFRTPSALAFLDPAQALVVDRATGRLRLATLDTNGGVVTVAGMPDGTEPTAHTITDRPDTSATALTSAPLRDPTDIALQLDVDPPVAWVAESGRLRRFVLTDVAAPDTWTTDAVEIDGLIRPAALAIEAGDLYVADEDAHAVFRIDTASGLVEVVAGIPGARGDAGDGGAATSALLNAPAGVAVRGDVLLVADTGNNRVRRVELTPGGSITPFLGDGEPASGGEGRPASAFPVLAPRGIAIDEVGNVIVAASNVIRFVQAGRPGLATADDDVRTIYGRAPRETFPDSATRCLDDVVFAPAPPGERPLVVTVDACVGIVLPLVAR
jgi:hypothetical protein